MLDAPGVEHCPFRGPTLLPPPELPFEAPPAALFFSLAIVVFLIVLFCPILPPRLLDSLPRLILS